VNRPRRSVPLDVIAAVALIVLSLLAAWPVWATRPPIVDHLIHYQEFPPTGPATSATALVVSR
jgi:hypothetical protein